MVLKWLSSKREDEDHLPDEVEPDRLVREAAAHPPISTFLTSLGIGLEHFLEIIAMFISCYCIVYVHCSASCNHLILSSHHKCWCGKQVKH